LPDIAIDDTQARRRYLWRLAAWFVAIVLLDCGTFALWAVYYLGEPFGAGVLVLVAVELAAAWALGLFDRAAGAVGVVGATFLLAPATTLGALIALYYATTVTEPPPLIDGIDVSRNGPAAQQAVSAAIHRQFPPGTPESTLLDTLKDQGFKIDRSGHTAHYTWNRSVICGGSVDVQWTVSPRRALTSADGRAGIGCL